MKEDSLHILDIPPRKITRRSTAIVDRDMMRAWDVAAPLFRAGCTSFALAELLDYKGDRHRRTSHQFNLIIQGSMRYRVENRTFIARAGDLICIPKGVLSRRTGLSPVVWIYIDLEDIPAWTPLTDRGLSIRKYESADLMYILTRRIIEARFNPDAYSLGCAQENSRMLVMLLKRELHQSAHEWSAARMGDLASLLDDIRQCPDAEWSRAMMAERANMSERNLSRLFQRAFGMPPAKMVTAIRMDVATRMLTETDAPLKSIASAIGYESPFSFSRLFRKHLGVSPGVYRKLPEGQRLQPQRPPPG